MIVVGDLVCDGHDYRVKTCKNSKLKTESGADCNHRVTLFEN